MDDVSALKTAVELLHMPSRVRALRTEVLPTGMGMVLEIAAGEAEAIKLGAALTDRAPELVRQAAGFFIEQILLSPEADSYRVLGASSSATSVELRRNMALLLRWLHPDVDLKAERSMFAGRVTKAWEDLKTPERRAAYDAQRRSQLAAKPSKSGKSGVGPPKAGASGQRGSKSPASRPTGGGQRKGFIANPLRQGSHERPPGLLVRIFGFFLGPRR